MRAVLSLLLLAGCSFPDLAMAPDGQMGPAPRLSPLDPLVEGVPERDPGADEALEARAKALRKRASALPKDPIEPETRQAMEEVASP